MESLISTGFYGFMDYAVTSWVRHVEQGVSSKDEDENDNSEVSGLAESLEAFLDIHFKAATSERKLPQVSKGNERRLKVFEHQPFFPSLQKAVIFLRKELTFYGQMKQSEIVLDLTETVERVRSVLEAAYTESVNNQHSESMKDMYGLRVFKCPRLSCRYFYDGFVTAQERDQHRDRHERPFRCTVPGCLFYSVGFETLKIAQDHARKEHKLSEDDAAAFPDMADIVEGWGQEPPVKRKDGDDRYTQAPQSKRPKVTEWSCPHCPKLFKKKFNFDSHLITHSSRRDFVCDKCGKAFARENDCKRHEKNHGARQFVCGETLPDGSSWGCGSKFARLDTLQEHHRSAGGKACLASQKLVSQATGFC